MVCWTPRGQQDCITARRCEAAGRAQTSSDAPTVREVVLQASGGNGAFAALRIPPDNADICHWAAAAEDDDFAALRHLAREQGNDDGLVVHCGVRDLIEATQRISILEEPKQSERCFCCAAPWHRWWSQPQSQATWPGSRQTSSLLSAPRHRTVRRAFPHKLGAASIVSLRSA